MSPILPPQRRFFAPLELVAFSHSQHHLPVIDGICTVFVSQSSLPPTITAPHEGRCGWMEGGDGRGECLSDVLYRRYTFVLVIVNTVAAEYAKLFMIKPHANMDLDRG